MGFEIPTSEPTELTAGDSWKWDVSLTDFDPSDGWQLSYAVRGPADLDIAWGTHVSANGGTFEVRVPAADTGLAAATYRLVGHVSDGTDRHIVYDEVFTVLADPAAEVNALSHDETVLAALDALIEGRSTEGVNEFTILGRSVSKMTPDELLKWQNIYRSRVTAARHGGELTPSFEVSFNAP